MLLCSISIYSTQEKYSLESEKQTDYRTKYSLNKLHNGERARVSHLKASMM